jgi:SAM-dependent methyltransferase
MSAAHPGVPTCADEPGAAFRAFEAAGWNDGRAAPYDRLFGPVTGAAAAPLLAAAGVGAGSRVLDVATGTGTVAEAALACGASVTGVDVAPQMLALAARRCPGIDLHLAAAEALPMPDDAFDAAVAGFLLPHLADPPAVVTEMARVVAPGGRVALSTWHPEDARLFVAVRDAVAAAGAEPPPGLPAGPPFSQFAREDELCDLLAGAGLAEPQARTVRLRQRIDDVDACWDDLMTGTVRTSALVRGQPEPVRAAILAEFRRTLDRHHDGTAVVLECAVVVGAGRAR